mmetsp:Transcript_16264/g.46498  ORF Transcript_16264/g.46498 Transcript_16264/m.46498 type:complete len:285 (+) Transcript_16264:79-933(+)
MCARGRSFLLKEGQNIVDDGVQEDAPDADGAPGHLDRGQALAHHERYTSDDDHALCGVRDRLRHGIGLFDRHRGEFVVDVEPETGEDQIRHDHLVCLEQGQEGSKLMALRDEHQNQAEEERVDRGQRELVPNAAHALLQALGRHQLLVLVGLDRGEDVCDGSCDQGRPSEVELAEGRHDHASDDGDQAEPLRRAHLGAVEEDADERRERGLRRLHDLAERDGAGADSEHRERVRRGGAEAHGQGPSPVGPSRLRESPRIRITPQEEGPQDADAQLQGGDGHRES